MNLIIKFTFSTSCRPLNISATNLGNVSLKEFTNLNKLNNTTENILLATTCWINLKAISFDRSINWRRKSFCASQPVVGKIFFQTKIQWFKFSVNIYPARWIESWMARSLNWSFDERRWCARNELCDSGFRSQGVVHGLQSINRFWNFQRNWD